jgi:opacity protein-like surface antigen
MKMKSFPMLLAALLLPTLAAATEITPGAIEITGGSRLGVGSFNIEETTKTPGLPNEVVKTDRSAFDFEAGALYYLTKNVGVGLELGYAREKNKSGPVTVTESLFTIGPKVGVDVGIAEKLSVFGEGAILYATGTFKEEDATDPAANVKNDRSGYVLGLGAGLKYFPVRAFSLNIGIDYRYRSLTEKQPAGVEVVTTTGGIGAFAGLSFYFGN